MAHVIYAIKMFLFRNQFQLSTEELSGLKRFTAFTGALYVKAWFSAPSAIAAPAGDLSFLKGLVSYPDSDIAKATSKKFARHLWYLSEDLAGLALFDSSITDDEKRGIVAALKDEADDDHQPRATVDTEAKEAVANKTVADFVTSASGHIFEAFNIDTDFLVKDPSEWEEDPSFQSSKKALHGIAVVNDFAERGVALIQDYNQILTKDEQQRQYLLQVVEWHRRQFPEAKKS